MYYEDIWQFLGITFHIFWVGVILLAVLKGLKS
jgi:hypothetical protein